MAAMTASASPQPELLDALRRGANPFGIVGTRRFLQLLGNGTHHLILHDAVGEAEHLDVTDLGVTIRSLASIRFPTGTSFWEWEPNGAERLAPLSENNIPKRCGFLVVADGTGQRGILHFADYRPGQKIHGRSLAMVFPVSITFDLRDECAQPHSILSMGDETHYADQPDLPVDQMTAFDMETSPQEAAAFMRHFGAIPSPLYKADPRLAFPQNEAAFDPRQWELFRSLTNDLIHEVTPFLCMQLVIRSSAIRQWHLERKRGRLCFQVQVYDLEVRS